MWVEWLRILRVMVGEGAERKSTTADLAAITWTALLGTIRTPPTTLRERSVTTDTHHSKSKNSKRMLSSLTTFTPFFLSERVLDFFFFWVNLISLFKECPHPDEKQRLELSKRLCLETRQVKFWFQNRRTQMKVIINNNITHVNFSMIN